MLLRTQRLASKDLALPPGVAQGRARPLDEQAAAQMLSRGGAMEAAQQLTLARGAAKPPQPPDNRLAVLAKIQANKKAAAAAAAATVAAAAPADPGPPQPPQPPQPPLAPPPPLNGAAAAAATTLPPAPPAPPARVAPLSWALPALSSSVAAVCVSATGRQLGVGLLDGSLLVLRPSGGSGGDAPAVWSQATAHAGDVCCVRFLEDGLGLGEREEAASSSPSPLLLSSGEDGCCALWSAEDGDGGGSGGGQLLLRRRWRLDCPTADRSYCGLPSARGGRESLAIVQLLTVEPGGGTEGGGGGGGGGWRFSAAVGASVALLDACDAAGGAAPAGTEAAPAAPLLRAPAGVTALAYARGARYLCASGNGGVALWSDFGRGAPLASLIFKGPLDTMSLSPDGRYVACGAQDATLVLWPLGTAAAEARLRDGAAPEGVMPGGAAGWGGGWGGTGAPAGGLVVSASAGSGGGSAGGDGGGGDSKHFQGGAAALAESEGDAALCGGATLFFGGFEHKVGSP